MIHSLVLWVLQIVYCKAIKIDVSNLSFIYIFIVDNHELEPKNSQSILMSESLLDCVVVDVPVDHVELKWVPGQLDYDQNEKNQSMLDLQSKCVDTEFAYLTPSTLCSDPWLSPL